jgi:hypothetical protein
VGQEGLVPLDQRDEVDEQSIGVLVLGDTPERAAEALMPRQHRELADR